MDNLQGSQANRLVDTLNALGVPFLSGGSNNPEPLSHVELICGLAVQTDARMRLALIPLFLSRPDLADSVDEALQELSGISAIQLKLFYTAALYLQQIYRQPLNELVDIYPPLPDRFSTDLDIMVSGLAEVDLTELGERHKQLVGIHANWVGTYHHGAKRLLTRLQREIAWGIR